MRLACAALTGTLLFVGTACTTAEPPPEITAPPSEEPPPSPSHPHIDAVDQQLVDLVLGDLLSAEAGETPLSQKGKPPAMLLVSSRSAGWATSLDDVLSRHDPAAWSDFPASLEASLRQAAQQVVERVPVGFDGFWSADERVKTIEPAAEPVKWSRSDRRPIRVWPPGHSADGALAIVCLTIPWSMHSSRGTYVLQQTESGWTVLVRHFVYFC